MTGPDLKALRHRMGLHGPAFGRAMGYATPTNGSLASAVSRLEAMERVPEWLGRLAVMYERHGIPEEWRG